MKKIILDLNSISVEFKAQQLVTFKYFKEFIKDYYNFANNTERPNFEEFKNYNENTLISFLTKIACKDEEELTKIQNLDSLHKDSLLNLVDSIYDYYRKVERYLIFVNNENKKLKRREFIQLFRKFSTSIADCYRDIYETILGNEQTVYRELPSGGNAGVLLTKSHVNLPSSLEFLKDIPLMEMVLTQPPFIIKTKQNKRVGFFFEKDLKITKDEFDYKNSYGVLISIYDTKALVYFDLAYMGFIVALGNLFKVESYDPKKDKNIDFVVLFGTNSDFEKCYYYQEDNKLIGILPKKANIDYFGYAKKMILTLFNITMIKRGLLPIHGAGIQIRHKDKVKNFVILGDSGAGKSETIEAIKSLYNNMYQIETIFDDMGTFHIIDNKVYATGTEIGAFVRLDDLDQGYSLRSVDRAVFLNIDEVNSRVVIPIEDYSMARTPHVVDAFLVADNYSDSEEGIEFYNNIEKAENDFIAGKRVAMGTTSENGLVSTFFANPFGPVQLEKEVRSFLPDYFKTLFNDKVPVGKIYTRLSLDRKDGPKIGASKLIELFEKL